ncbi:hypothetical protein [Paenibacillus sp. PK3_47]|uniref:hypothetical protein n=1 Tax=Paenibacillus sp. PK3_47 TaxID=2072642 RepID=UPI00201DBE9E|nr:hypothetical protein [Paenibacillus sp. PK3_47]
MERCDNSDNNSATSCWFSGSRAEDISSHRYTSAFFRFLIGRDGRKAGPTFHRILQNIKDVHEEIKINIRVNVDRTNIGHVDQILDLLEEHGLRNKVGFYIAAVDDSASSCANPDCFSSYEFSGEEMQVYRKALQRGFNTIRMRSRFSVQLCY